MRCATISQARASRLYDFACLLCRSVSLCLNIISLAFFIVTGCLQMCVTVSVKSQRCLFGITGRNTASDSLLGVVARQEINLPLACRAQSKGRSIFFMAEWFCTGIFLMSAHINTSIPSPLVLCHMAKTYIQDLNVHLSVWSWAETGSNNWRRQGHNDGVSELTCMGQSFKWCDAWTLTLPQHNKMQGCVPSISKGWNKS